MEDISTETILSDLSSALLILSKTKKEMVNLLENSSKEIVDTIELNLCCKQLHSKIATCSSQISSLKKIFKNVIEDCDEKSFTASVYNVDLHEDESFNDRPNESINDAGTHSQVELKRFCESYVKKGYCHDQNCYKRHSDNISVAPSLADLDKEEGEFDYYDPLEEYMPTDEKRICKFYEMNGKCWRKNCNYEHRETFKWTHDVVPVCGGAFNSINLPEKGSVESLLVVGIVSPVIMYCQLPNKYSDIGEGNEHFETLIDLQSDLNKRVNTVSFKTLPIAPSIGEYVIALVDGIWYRAIVCDTSEFSAVIFLLDYGRKCNVKLKMLRLTEPRFMHLPFQAVTCQIFNLGLNSDSRLPFSELTNLGVSFLTYLILNKKVTAKIMFTDYDDQCLHISFEIDGEDVSKILVDQGFCLPLF